MILIVPAMVPALLVGIIVWQVWRRPLARDPLCGHCGYIVRGISSLTCPECGSDLREAGIFPAGMRLPIGARGRIVIWSAALPFLAAPLSLILQYAAGPTLYQHRMHRGVLAASLGSDITVEKLGWKLYWGGHWRAPAVPLQVLRLSQGNPVGGGRPLMVNMLDDSYQFMNANGAKVSNPDGFGAPVIAAWLAAQGPATALPPTASQAAVADNIMTAIEEMPARNTQMTSPWGVTVFPTFTDTYPVTQWWNFAVWIGLWLLVWLAGVRRIRRRAGVAPARAREAHEISPIG
jgi:hypothetical protein